MRIAVHLVALGSPNRVCWGVVLKIHSLTPFVSFRSMTNFLASVRSRFFGSFAFFFFFFWNFPETVPLRIRAKELSAKCVYLISDTFGRFFEKIPFTSHERSRLLDVDESRTNIRERPFLLREK